MPAAGAVTANLIVEHQFTGGGGSTVSDTSGNSNTLTLGVGGSTVLAANGTSQVAPSWDALGLLFDNATNTVATWADGSIVSESTTDFTAELWLKPISNANSGAYFNFGWNDTELEENSNPSYFWPTWFTSNYRTGSSGSTDTPSISVVNRSGFGFPFGSWYQLVVTRSPSTGILTSYINGAHENDSEWAFGPRSPFATSGMAFPATAPSGLRALRCLGGDSFDGDGVSALFGELRFYNSVLSDADVLQNYNARALAVTGSPPATPRKPSSGLSGGMKPLLNGGVNA